jgi:glutamate--cysteine ligase
MMYRTCTVQVNLDYASEADMVKKLRVALALQPVATALFASSPFFDGKPNGHRSWRSRIWRGLDDSRTGMLPFAFDEGIGFQALCGLGSGCAYVFSFTATASTSTRLGQSFRDFLRGELPALPGEKPTLSDWADHMTTVFPEARVKKYIEMRGADVGDRDHIVALPAFWVGLMYDDAALDAAWDLVKGFDAETARRAARCRLGIEALAGEANGVRGGRPAAALFGSGALIRSRAGGCRPPRPWVLGPMAHPRTHPADICGQKMQKRRALSAFSV